MRFCDAHVHALWSSAAETRGEVWKSLVNQGLESAGLIVMGHYPKDRQRCLELIPTDYHRAIEPDFFDKEPQPFHEVLNAIQVPDPFFYLDSRYLTKDEAELTRFATEGYQGLKLLYVPEEDRINGMIGWEKHFGRTPKESEELTASLAQQAADLGWPIILHADLNRYREFVSDLIQSNPQTYFIIPHFGFSRKHMAGLLERFSLCFTDFSSLLPFMREKPKAYREFVLTYQDRVLFGSDATLNWPEMVQDYVSFSQSLFQGTPALPKVLFQNYKTIHAKTQ